MSWIAWTLIAYIVVDRIYIVGIIGRSIDITPSMAVASLITGALFVWAVLSLAGVA